MEMDSKANFEDEFERKVEFKVVTEKELSNDLKETVAELKAITGLRSTKIRVLLNRYKWDKERFLEAYFAGDSGKFVKSIICSILGLKNGKKVVNSSKNKECLICFSSDTTVKMLSLKCNHAFCSNCWISYISSKIKEYNLWVIKCPEYCCQKLVDDEKVLNILRTEEEKDCYNSLVINSYINCNQLLRWCPTAGCENIIQVKSLTPGAVKCTCGTVFCFGCGDVWHETLLCAMYKKWINLYEDKDAKASMDYICANTKSCISCGVPIEKNGGCNHMHCTKCNTHFCWLCMGSMMNDLGGHRCNAYQNDSGKNQEIEKRRSDLKRFLHYSSRYGNHNHSLKKEEKLINKIDALMTYLQEEKNVPWIETQYLKKTVDVLRNCRRTLTFTYVFAYFLQSSNQQLIFEDNQHDLENAVEKLSGVMEREDLSMSDKCRIMDMQRYCEDRRKVLIKHVNEGYDKDWWEFIV